MPEKSESSVQSVDNIVTDNLDPIIDAPDGIKRLRELILQLAVQGKLVEQRPEEGTADELLIQIEEAKRKNVEARRKRGERIRKTKPLPPIIEGEIPFDIPENWVPMHLAEFGQWAIGAGFPKKEQGHSSGDILFCKVSDMNLEGNEKYLKTSVNYISHETAIRIRANINPAGTVVFPKIGGAIATNKRRVVVSPTIVSVSFPYLTHQPNGYFFCSGQ